MSVTSPVHETDPRQSAIPDTHGHAKGEHKPYAEERPIPYSARMLFLWFYHACRRGYPRFLMVADHMNSLTFEDPAAVHAVRRAIKHAEAGDLYGAAEIANVEVGHAAVVHEGITRRGMRLSIGAEVDNDPRSRPDAQNIVDAMKPDAMIRSIHFLTIPHPQTGAEYQWPFDNPEFVSVFDAVGVERVWELYMEQLLDAIEKLPGQIVGHFYVPAKFGHWPDDAVLRAYEDRLIEACAQHGKAVELNTRFFYRYATDEASRVKFREANLRLLRKAKAANVGIAVGSDAHSPKDQGQSFDEALQLLDEAEVNELVFPIAGRLRTVALRATREHLEDPAALNPTAPAEAVAPVTAEPSGSEAEAAADRAESPSGRDENSGDEAAPGRPKRATSKRPAGASSKRTTPGPAKGETARGEARTPEAAPPATEADGIEAARAAAEFAKAEHERLERARAEFAEAEREKAEFDRTHAEAAVDTDPAPVAATKPKRPATKKAATPAPVAVEPDPVPQAATIPAEPDEAPAATHPSADESSAAESAPPPVPKAAAKGPADVKDATKPASINAKPAKSVSSKPAPSKRAPSAKPAVSKATPAKAAPPKAAPVKAAPSKAVATKAGPGKPAPAKAVPAKSAPVKTTSAKSAAVKGAPAKNVPAKAASAKVAPKSAASKRAKSASKTGSKTIAKPAAKAAVRKPDASPKTAAKPVKKTAVKAVGPTSKKKSPAAKKSSKTRR